MLRAAGCLLASVCALIGALDPAHAKELGGWLFGTWTAIADEDGTPADIMSFGPGGKYTNYGVGCAVNSEMQFHTHEGDVYVTGEIPGKGPVALVFRPSADKSKLTYTSPRTRNNATYARLTPNPCQ